MITEGHFNLVAIRCLTEVGSAFVEKVGVWNDGDGGRDGDLEAEDDVSGEGSGEGTSNSDEQSLINISSFPDQAPASKLLPTRSSNGFVSLSPSVIVPVKEGKEIMKTASPRGYTLHP